MPASRTLPQLLNDARSWFDRALLAAMSNAGTPPVTPTQLQLFAALDEEGTTISELARRMGVARQTAHQAVHSLVAAGLLDQISHPSSARERLIRRTQDGVRAHRQALLSLERLEAELARRIGQQTVDALQAALEAPWGDPPLSLPS